MTEHTPLLRAGDIGNRQVVRIGLWWTAGKMQDWPCSAGFKEAKDLITQAAGRHPETVKVYEGVTKDEGLMVYEQSVKTSASPPPQGGWDYRVHVFGTSQYQGCWAGREVPLLLIQFDGVTVLYAAPHEMRREHGGSRERPLRTILDVIRMLGDADQQRIFGTQLGPVSAVGSVP